MTQAISGDGPPRLVLLDVNETLSDLAPMTEVFAGLGVPADAAATAVRAWFAATLRDGFALCLAGAPTEFAAVAQDALRTSLTGTVAPDDLPDAVEQVMGRFTSLPVHDDVASGLGDLAAAGVRLVTLSNGSTSVAEDLLERAGLYALVERLLSVEDAPTWKPDPRAYAYALAECGVEAREAMLVAAHPWDVAGAARAGLRTAWVNRTGAPWPESCPPPDVEVSFLAELPAAVAAG